MGMRSCNIYYTVEKGVQSPSELAINSIGRWRRLHIRYAFATDCRFRQLTQSLHSGYAPQLECIQIYDRAERYQQTIGDLLHSIIVQGAPALRCIRLCGSGFRCSLPPFGSVTFLELNYTFAHLPMTYTQMWDMFSDLPALIELTIRGDVFDFSHQAIPHIMIQLPHLESLNIWTICGWEVGQLLRVLSAPQLASMTFGAREPGCAIASNFPQYPLLRSLTVEFAVNMSVRDMKKLSTAFPSITHLTISRHVMQRFITFLQEREITTGLLHWPNLQTIVMKRTSFHWNEPELLADALSARLRMGSPIERLVLSKDVLLEARLRLRDSVVRTFLGITVKEGPPDDVQLEPEEDWDDYLF
jgi:hypothetical protein